MDYILCHDAAIRRCFSRKLQRAVGRGLRRISPESEPIVGRQTRAISWGCSGTFPTHTPVQWVGNTPEAVSRMSHKIRMLENLAAYNVLTVQFTADRDEAQRWLDEGSSVYARTVLQGHSGEGIEYVQSGDALPQAPLYTKRIPLKWIEGRVHVVNGEVIAVQRKRRMTPELAANRGIDLEAVDDHIRGAIRTYAHGWSFCILRQDDFDTPEVRELALAACRALGAVHAAVDIALTRRGPLVIELNSAPALRSPVVFGRYVRAFRRLLGGE